MIPEQIEKYVSHLANNFGSLSRADIDELMMLSDAYKNTLPARFIKIAMKFETQFNIDDPHNSLTFLSRLSRVIEVHASLPRVASSTEITDSDLAFFQITEMEKTAIALLASDMRKIITTSRQFDSPHKVRLLKRIAAIEQEIHKEKGMFDVILGGISDFGETAGKFGEDVKPLVQRMSEIEQITRGKSPDYAQIEKPEEVKRLPPPEKTDA